MNSHLLRTTALALSLLATGATFAQSSSAACTAGQSSSLKSGGEIIATYDLKAAKGARMTSPAPACVDATPSPQAVRESPSKASLGKSKEYTGHVTLMK